MSCSGPCKVHQWLLKVESIIVATGAWIEYRITENPPGTITGYIAVSHTDPCPTALPTWRAVEVVKFEVARREGVDWRPVDIGCEEGCRCQPRTEGIAAPVDWSAPITGQVRALWSSDTRNQLWADIAYTVRIGLSITPGTCVR